MSNVNFWWSFVRSLYPFCSVTFEQHCFCLLYLYWYVTQTHNKWSIYEWLEHFVCLNNIYTCSMRINSGTHTVLLYEYYYHCYHYYVIFYSSSECIECRYSVKFLVTDVVAVFVTAHNVVKNKYYIWWNLILLTVTKSFICSRLVFLFLREKFQF